MSIGNSFANINQTACGQPVYPTQPKFSTPYQRLNTTQGVASDMFSRLNNDNNVGAPAWLERLFPNNELHKIYNHIIQEYGIENPPPLVFKSMPKVDAYALYLQIFNEIEYNIYSLNNLQNKKKMRFEYEDENGKKYSGYYTNQYRDNGILLWTDKEYNDFIKKTECNKKGIKTSLENLTDDDLRSLVISIMAHELRHAYQYQRINQSEGLDINRVIINNPLLNKEKNLIARKLMEIKMYNQCKDQSVWNKIPKEIKYKKGTDEWNFNNDLYYSFINYTNDNNSDYTFNLSEVDANESAKTYLETFYPQYDITPSQEVINKLDEKLYGK